MTRGPSLSPGRNACSPNGLTRFAILLAAGALVATAVPPASGNDWLRFRGPNGDGISTEKDWNPMAITNGPRILWRGNVGKGYSAVSVKGERLYTMGNATNYDTVYCLNAKTGAEVWRHSYACGPGDQYPGSRGAPFISAASVVYTMSRDGHVFCLDAEKGAVIWQKNVISELQAQNLTWGLAGSPVVENDLLLLNAASYGIALDAKIGGKVWASPPGRGGYATPAVYTAGGKRCAAIFGEKAVHGVDVATGGKLWSYPWVTAYDVNAADPIVVGNKMFLSSGYSVGCALLDISKAEPSVIWKNKSMNNHFSSCVLLAGFLYGVDGNVAKGALVCLSFDTGEEKWRKDLGFGSLIVADGKIICLNEAGSLFIAEATPTGYKEIARCSGVLPRTCWTAPTLSGGLIYCRNEKGDLACVDVRK